MNKTIHRLSWYSNDGTTKKEIDHTLVSTHWRSLLSCRVHRGFEFHSDHRQVVAELTFLVKKIVSAAVRAKRYDVRKLEDQARDYLSKSVMV